MAGEYAASKGYPIMNPAEDIRLGPDQINNIVDAIAQKLENPSKQGVNTDGDIGTTHNMRANGKIFASEMESNTTIFLGQSTGRRINVYDEIKNIQDRITNGFSTNGVFSASELHSNTTVILDYDGQKMDVLNEIKAIKARLGM